MVDNLRKKNNIECLKVSGHQVPPEQLQYTLVFALELYWRDEQHTTDFLIWRFDDGGGEHCSNTLVNLVILNSI